MPHEPISVFDMFKIGVGPSSSHTLGPWRAALRFIETLNNQNLIQQTFSITVLLYGSLAKTGRGHGINFVVLLGLWGKDLLIVVVSAFAGKCQGIKQKKKLWLT